MPRKKTTELQNSTQNIEKTTNKLSSKKKTSTTSSKKNTSSKKSTKTSTTKASSKTTKSLISTRKRKTNTKKTTNSKIIKKDELNKSVEKDFEVNSITSSTNLTEKIEVLEYYDLPYRYNQTVVKVLAQTPTTLFIYWDISNIDRKNFVTKYGENFFNYTKPVLIIHNHTMHYSFEIDIDDFANSWYLHVNDSNCEYTVELGRRPKYYNEEKYINIPNNYLHITSSNIVDSPNDHVLFDKNLKTIYFKDVKTNIVTAKNITSLSFLRNIGKFYNLYDLQSDFNNNDLKLGLNNPSSSSSPTFK